MKNKDYETAKKVFEGKEERHFAYGQIIIARYYILVSCFALNEIETARELLSKTRWNSMGLAIKYYEILLNLKDNEIDLARENFEVLIKKAKKVNPLHVNKLKQIFACINTNNFEDKFFSDSINPIVKEIYDFYSNNSVQDIDV